MPLESADRPHLTVFCFDPTGYEQVQVTLAVGDTVEYKRNGFRGTCRGQILAVSAAKRPLRVQPLGRDGVPFGEPIHRGCDGIHRAWRSGILLGVPEAFDGLVIAYEVPAQAGVDGWLEVERMGRGNIRFNSASPGWPTQALRIGETVRCEMRNVPDSDRPTWFVLAREVANNPAHDPVPNEPGRVLGTALRQLPTPSISGPALQL